MEVEIFSKYHGLHKQDEKLTTGLFLSEFSCKCNNDDCTFTLVNRRLLNVYAIVRKYFGSAIGVTSGFRCQRHNKSVNGMRDSYHKKGSAIDIFPHNGDMEKLYSIAVEFFDLVIYYKDEGFLHCQIEE